MMDTDVLQDDVGTDFRQWMAKVIEQEPEAKHGQMRSFKVEITMVGRIDGDPEWMATVEKTRKT